MYQAEPPFNEPTYNKEEKVNQTFDYTNTNGFYYNNFDYKQPSNFEYKQNNASVTYNPILQKDFYNIPTLDLAKYLLGKVLIRNLNGTILKSRIIETECYPGWADQASHSYNGRRTKRTEAMFMEPGTSYVYFTYGVYFCFNISSADYGGVVLIRACEPLDGIDTMMENRMKRCKMKKGIIKLQDLCNGPSKLCMSMDITKDACNTLDLTTTNNEMWIENDYHYYVNENVQIVQTRRIGIDRTGEEAVNKPFRFYIYGNPHVSKRDRTAEKNPISIYM